MNSLGCAHTERVGANDLCSLRLAILEVVRFVADHHPEILLLSTTDTRISRQLVISRRQQTAADGSNKRKIAAPVS
jgi:hypothetical protein